MNHPLRDRLIDAFHKWLPSPPEVVPIKRTWSDWFKDTLDYYIAHTITWMLEMAVWYRKRSK